MKLTNITQTIRSLSDKYIGRLTDTQKKQIIGYIYIILTLITVSFFGLFAIAPTLSTIGNLNKQYQDSKLVYDALNKKLTNLQLLDNEYKDIQTDLPIIYTAVPQTTKIPELTRKLEDVATLNNVTVSRLTFGEVEVYPNSKKSPIYSFTFTIGVVGTQQNVNNFIESVIDFDRIIGIDKIITGVDQEGKYTAQVTGRAYFVTK
ncbi:MAG TPA: type 4a pilus biogenesis protein PilO [Patescibacteria group bacterium]|nr:type 4a pilus biogenesis protein PilO [Patescibacteria group bacterium]